MKTYYSISKFPGNQGKHFYNSFFKMHNINALYIPIGVNKDQFLNQYKQLLKTASGISVSMPYKQAVINLLD